MTIYIKKPNITTRVYNQNDNLVDIKNAKNNSTFLNYGVNDELLSETFGLYSKQWVYNTDGSVKSFKDKKGHVFIFTVYPQGDQREGLLQNDGVASYDYYLNTKRLKTVSTFNKVITFFYDGFLRISKITYTEGSISHSIEYRYDKNGNVIQIIYPDGKIIYYEYDLNDNLVRVKDWANRILVSYSYLADGRLSTTNYGNGSFTTYVYDAIGRSLGLENRKANNSLISSHSIKLDLAGGIVEADRQRANGEEYPKLIENTKNFGYDVINRLTVVNGVAVTHDNNGNPISFGDQSFVWDISNQLLNSNSPSENFGFEYDPFGNRVKKNNTRYVVDILNNANILNETDLNGTPTSMFVYGLGLVCRYDYGTNSFNYYHFDERGSTTEISDASGNTITHKYNYDGHGNNFESVETFQQPFKYIGKYGVVTDSKNLYFMRARYYNPQIGRFLSEDPVWGTNLYHYANNDPLNLIDPNGTFAMSNSVGIGESLIPLWGSLRQAHYYAGQGNYGLAALNSAFAIIDIIGVGTAIKAVKVAKIAMTGGVVANFTKSNFRNNLIKATGFNPGKTSQAHHVFPQKFESIFGAKGINIHDPKFGSWWETTSHSKNASGYNASWETFLKTNPSKSQILNYGRQLMGQYGFTQIF